MNKTTIAISHDTMYELKSIFPRLKSHDERISRLIQLHNRLLGKPSEFEFRDDVVQVVVDKHE